MLTNPGGGRRAQRWRWAWRVSWQIDVERALELTNEERARELESEWRKREWECKESERVRRETKRLKEWERGTRMTSGFQNTTTQNVPAT